MKKYPNFQSINPPQARTKREFGMKEGQQLTKSANNRSSTRKPKRK